MSIREYRVGPEFNLPKVIAQAEKIAARAAKKGLSGGYTVTTETRIEDMPDKNSPFYVEGATFNPTKPTTITTVVIEGEPVKYDGWAFVAVVEYENDQPVVTGSPWYEGPQVDRDALKKGYCDHCQTVRRRAKTIVVENEAGERKQVGTSCVKDFLGQEVTGAWYSEKDPFAELDGFYGSGGVAAENFADILTYAAGVIRQKGWVPGWKRDSETTTSSRVRLVSGPRPTAYGRGPNYAGNDWDELRAGMLPEDADTAARAFEYGRTIDGDSDYALNVRAVFGGTEPMATAFFDPKRLGLVVSVVALMLKNEGELAAKEKAPEITEALYADPKTKIEIADAVVTDVIGFESDWGGGQIIVLVGQGYRFKWMTSSFPGLAVGDEVDFKATVKGEDVWNDRVSTSVLRLKVMS